MLYIVKEAFSRTNEMTMIVSNACSVACDRSSLFKMITMVSMLLIRVYLYWPCRYATRTHTCIPS